METADFFTYRDQAIADFDGLVEFHQMNFDLLKRGEPDRVSTGVVSPNFFDVLGITPSSAVRSSPTTRPRIGPVPASCRRRSTSRRQSRSGRRSSAFAWRSARAARPCCGW
jgi:hypothetical protein